MILINQAYIASVFKVLVVRKKLFELNINVAKKGIIFNETLNIILIQRKKINLALCIVAIKILDVLLVINKNYFVGYEVIQSLSELEVFSFYPKYMGNLIVISEEPKED